MTTYKVNIQKDINDTFLIVSTVLETTDKKVWWSKINEYRKNHFIDILETTATVNVQGLFIGGIFYGVTR